MNGSSEYVRPDEHGVLRVGASRVMLDSVLAAWSQGQSPETIQSQYPSLSLEEVYGALAWSLAHSVEVTTYLQKQNTEWERWKRRAESQPSPLRDRLRSAKTHAGAQ